MATPTATASPTTMSTTMVPIRRFPNTKTYSLSPGSGSTITINTLLKHQRHALDHHDQLTGNSAIQVSSVALTGHSAISRTSAASFTIAPHSSARIDIRCAASSVGTFHATVAISHNASSSPNTYSIVCRIGNSVTITSAAPPASTYGSHYSYRFATSATQAASSYSITSGVLPPGLTLSSTGQISGKPTAVGAYLITVRVTTPNGNASQTYTLMINKAPLIIRADNKTRGYRQRQPIVDLHL